MAKAGNDHVKAECFGGRADKWTAIKDFDWSQCISESGTKNCALCEDAGGALPCTAGDVNGDGHKGKASECPDGEMTRKLKYFSADGFDNTPRCRDMKEAFTPVESTNFKMFDDPGSSVITKAWITHPHNASPEVGVFVFKRIVTHLCSGKTGTCIKDTPIADVHKVAYCVKCPKTFRGESLEPAWFKSPQAWTKHYEWPHTIPVADVKEFGKVCFSKAFDPLGEVYPDFDCAKIANDGTQWQYGNQEFIKSLLMTF